MAHLIVRAALCLAVVAVVAAGLAGNTWARGDSIYDSCVAQRLTLTPDQRQQVDKIVAESKRQSAMVFEKYGIDPDGPPIFDQLMQASGELMAIARRERKAMKRVLTPEQLDMYDRIIEETSIRVRNAAQ